MFQVDSVSQLSDDQYLEALRAVHDYYVKNPSVRRSRHLTPDVGPQGLPDLGTDLEIYMGECPHVHRFFHFVVFVLFVLLPPNPCSENNGLP